MLCIKILIQMQYYKDDDSKNSSCNVDNITINNNKI